MTYQFINKEQLTIFLSSLQDLLGAKHEIIREALPAVINIDIVDGLAEEVSGKKLELNPSFRTEEFGLQIKFYQKNGKTGVVGYCWKNFDEPEKDNGHKWGRIDVPLATFRKSETKLNKGLELRKIRMGLSGSYIRRLCCIQDGDEKIKFWGSYVKKGSGFNESYWREEKDFENIVTKRVEQ